MIVVRNVFKLQFGKAKEGVALWKEGMALATRLGFKPRSSRLLTDLVGSFYTVVFESTFDSLTDFETNSKVIMSSPDWQAWYGRIAAITESGHREVFNVVVEQ
jgi:hypothetical protein